MTKSVRERIETLLFDFRAVRGTPAELITFRQSMQLLLDNSALFAASEETAAERDAHKAEVERLRGVIESLHSAYVETIREVAGLESIPNDIVEQDVERIGSWLRAALQPQGGE